ncbi:HAD-IIIC family phosphatase [candidate division KSB3 bacterium]|uniref:HAD-IIIC family phosphatase n=1 Tax=candidate division KSB3 bacterium TaxID=2044937 RepID=A0A9D5Q6I3_9BACT|nr:HAD-IIIC family phosphatase [candidate division KSB3 bacterium]MBD3324946.1 HAD-IIIC family phosphatase [candidate division KSB3 bacterium]
MGKEIKCVVWDLDNTIWDGTLLESDDVRLKPGIKDILATLDSRGILHSIASKNHYDDAVGTLKRFGLDAYFLYPEIHWNAKSLSIGNIQKHLNIGMDTILFIDDQEFERAEVQSVHQDITCLDAQEYTALLPHPRLNPKFITEDSQRRRLMYLQDMQRKEAEDAYQGPQEHFLASLAMRFIISEAQEDDLQRAEELTVRTNQLNSTGKTYDYEELNRFRQSDRHRLFICELIDTFGSYGKIGLALTELTDAGWHLKLLLMSCRVMSRGVGTVFLSFLMQEAKKHGNILLADFRKTERNRMMYVTYKFANFTEKTSDRAGNIVFENDLTRIQPFPPYIEVNII